MMSAPSQKAVLKRILKQLKGYRALLALTIIFALVSVAGNLIVPIFFGKVIDLFVEGESVTSNPQLYKLFAAIGVTIVITCLAQWLMSVINNKIAYNVVRDIRAEAFRKLQNLPLK